jgi:hypothetical protein
MNVHNPNSLKDHMEHRVAVQGSVDEAAGTIHVDKVNMITQSSKKPNGEGTSAQKSASRLT